MLTKKSPRFNRSGGFLQLFGYDLPRGKCDDNHDY